MQEHVNRPSIHPAGGSSRPVRLQHSGRHARATTNRAAGAWPRETPDLIRAGTLVETHRLPTRRYLKPRPVLTRVLGGEFIDCTLHHLFYSVRERHAVALLVANVNEAPLLVACEYTRVLRVPYSQVPIQLLQH